jgi:hypothetical protein
MRDELSELSRSSEVDNLVAIQNLMSRMTEPVRSPDFRSALAAELARLARAHPALRETDLGQRMVDIQWDYESASFDRSAPGDIPEH